MAMQFGMSLENISLFYMGKRGWGCFLTKIFLLSDENIFTLPFDENRLEPCFLTKI